MNNLFKDFCATLGFVNQDHPWTIDYYARSIIKNETENRKRDEFSKKVMARIEELKTQTADKGD